MSGTSAENRRRLGWWSACMLASVLSSSAWALDLDLTDEAEVRADLRHSVALELEKQNKVSDSLNLSFQSSQSPKPATQASSDSSLRVKLLRSKPNKKLRKKREPRRPLFAKQIVKVARRSQASLKGRAL